MKILRNKSNINYIINNNTYFGPVFGFDYKQRNKNGMQRMTVGLFNHQLQK